MVAKVSICGIPHKVIYSADRFNADLSHLGQINYPSAEIFINANLTEEMTKEALLHEIVHGILWHSGRNAEADDENLVQALANGLAGCVEVLEAQ